MGLMDSVRRAMQSGASEPQDERAAREAYRRRFLDNKSENLFMGVFDTLEAAAASAPPARAVGYDNPESAGIRYTHSIFPTDYPALFWLYKAVVEGRRSVFDLGGHVGIKYYAFQRAFDFPADLRWTVCDVPAVAALGREQARERDAAGRLAFTSDPAALDGFDVLYASGSLQYLPDTLAQMLQRAARKPARLVVNTTPIHPARSFFTLNSIGTAFCPYRVQSNMEFVSSLTALGYRKRDQWENTGKSMVIPFEEGCDVPHYSGYCFDLDPAAQTTAA